MRQINVWDSAEINTCSITLQNLILIDVQAKELSLKAYAPLTYYLHSIPTLSNSNLKAFLH